MQEHLDKVRQVITWYEECDLRHLAELSRALQVLTSNMYHLEVERAKYHDLLQKKIYNLTSEGMTVARAENQAHAEHPEIYMLRRVMNAGYRVTDVIRNNISFGKTEYKNEG